jgi:glycerol-3-phosphate O-acyltransferase/dihydroxyacetone phosphate acyltransferase
MGELAQQVNEYMSLLERNKLRDWVVRHGAFSIAGIILNFLMQILLLPVYLFGLLHNALPFFLPVKAVAKIKDLQFHSSVKMALGMIIFILQYIILATLAFIFLPLSYALLYLICIPISGWLAFLYYIWLKKTLAKWRFLSLSGESGSDKFRMIELRRQIISAVDSIIDRYSKA